MPDYRPQGTISRVHLSKDSKEWKAYTEKFEKYHELMRKHDFPGEHLRYYDLVTAEECKDFTSRVNKKLKEFDAILKKGGSKKVAAKNTTSGKAAQLLKGAGVLGLATAIGAANAAEGTELDSSQSSGALLTPDTVFKRNTSTSSVERFGSAPIAVDAQK